MGKNWHSWSSIICFRSTLRQSVLYILKGWLSAESFLHGSVLEEKELLAVSDDIICWQDLSPVSKRHSEKVCRCLSHGSPEYCHSLGCTRSCRWKCSCFWVCADTLRGQACHSAGPQELRPLWTTSSSCLWKHAAIRSHILWSTIIGYKLLFWNRSFSFCLFIYLYLTMYMAVNQTAHETWTPHFSLSFMLYKYFLLPYKNTILHCSVLQLFWNK